jgi:hypothetical protein
MIDGFGDEKTKTIVLENRGVALRFGVRAVLKVSQHNSAGFGAIRFSILIGLNHEDTH